ncbi:hypothetical protein ACIP4T_22565 [Streptomyces massasporeus]|uniref:hypothetical protein n=1 Tax=Streptomyces massasporeus TaxID=67324 RepID=UPI0036F061FA
MTMARLPGGAGPVRVATARACVEVLADCGQLDGSSKGKQEAVMACMPTEDVEFHDAIKEVFRRYPDAQGKYALSSLALENRIGVDFDKEVAVSRVEGRKIITEFKERKSVIRMQLCLKWNFDYTECLMWEEAPE